MDRVIKVTLLAETTGFAASFAQAKKATNELGTAFKEQSETIGKGLLAIGVAAGAGVGLAVAKFAEFDQAMSFVQAATHETAANMDLLRDAALDAGARTVFSATEAANAIEELAKAGVSTADILGGGLDGALDLAAAGGLDVANAAQIAATAITQFGLSGKDVPHVADLLAAGAGKAQGSVEDLSQALNQGGLVAKQTGLTLDETTGTLAAFASAGLLGSDAGTSLKTMLQRLTPQSDAARQTMEDLGISAYDAQGNFVGMTRFAGILQQGLKDLTPEARNSALSVMFGSDAVRAASVVYDQGAAGISTWISAVNDQGYAAETARLRLDNLKGDLEGLGGAFDTLFIKAGEGANGPLRGLVQLATDFVTAVADAPPFVQQTALAVGGLVAVVGIAGGAFFLAVPKIVEFRAALSVLSTSTIPGVAGAAQGAIGMAGRMGSAFSKVATLLTGPWGIALAAAGVAVSFLNSQIAEGVPTAADLDNALAQATKSADLLRAASQRGDVENTLWGSYYDSLKDLPGLLDKISGNDVWDWLNTSINEKGALDSLSRVGESFATLADSDLPAAQAEFRKLSKEYGLNKDQQAKLLDGMGPYRDKLTEVATQLGINVTSSDEAANAAKLLALANGELGGDARATATSLGDIGAAAKDSTGKITDLADAISNFNKPATDAVQAQIRFEQSAADVVSGLQDQKDAYEKANGSLSGFVANLDLSTQAGRDNMSNLLDTAQALNDWTAKQLAASGSVDESNAILAAGRQRLADLGSQFGLAGADLQAFVDRYAASPKDLRYQATVNGVQEMRDRLGNLYQEFNGKRITYYVDGTFSSTGGAMKGFASGGWTGAGGKYDITGVVHANEWVSNQETVAKPSNRAALEFMHAGGTMPANWNAPLAPQLMATVAAPAASAAPPQFTVVLQSKGGIDLTQYVEVAIQQDKARDARRARMG